MWLVTLFITFLGPIMKKIAYAVVTYVLTVSVLFYSIQVAPAELEALLLSHPDILDCAVIP